MTDIDVWLEEKIEECRPQNGGSTDVLPSLMSACEALATGEGMAFGLSLKGQELTDRQRLYELCCRVVEDWFTTLDDGELRGEMAKFVRRADLDVSIPEDLTSSNAAPAGTIETTLLRAAVAQLERAGMDVLAACDAPVPDRKIFGRIEEELAPVKISQALWDWMSTTPRRLVLEWTSKDADLYGSIHYDVEAIPTLYRECCSQVEDWGEGLSHYYTVWERAVPLLEVGDGMGFVAASEDGAIVYLDNVGNTDLNGIELAGDIDSFWQTWADLCFVALDSKTLEWAKGNGALTLPDPDISRLAGREADRE